jgi:folate-binding protein YgfZ
LIFEEENMSWQDFLNAQGATIDDERGVRFSAQPDVAILPSHGAVILPLSRFGLIGLEGEDTIPFLQGQLSSDVKQLVPSGSQFSSYSTPKGRMLASMLVVNQANGALLMLPKALVAAIQKRLSMYILRSKTRATDLGEAVVALGVIGPQAADLLATALAVPKMVDGGALGLDDGRVVRLAADRFLLFVPAAKAEAWWLALREAGAGIANESLWTLTDIRTGIPWVLPQTQEAFVPQMANMELIGAVSFKKGCYPGQEIVARTQYLGKLKRRAFRIRASEPLEPGQAIYSPEMNGQASGQVAMAVEYDGAWEALAVIQLSSIEHGLHLHGVDGPALEVLSLPYSVMP